MDNSALADLWEEDGISLLPDTAPITGKPANPTNQTSASFTYTNSQAGVTFECSLDGASFAACPSSGITYKGPLADGSHSFKVQAVSGKKTSSAASYSWVIDTKPPSIALSFPRNGGLYGAAFWNAGCSGGAGVCGGASDQSGIASVKVSILQQNTGKYWNGASFSSTSEVFNTASDQLALPTRRALSGRLIYRPRARDRHAW